MGPMEVKVKFAPKNMLLYAGNWLFKEELRAAIGQP